MKDSLFIAFQHLVPQALLSRFAGWLADTQLPGLKNLLISKFIAHFQVDMSEAQDEDYRNYESFNAFFTRPLKEGARSIATGNCLACPADGAVSQAGEIIDGRIFQAKGHEFSATELLGGNAELAEQFKDGSFTTIYLSPKDYHRVHMPIAGTLQQMTHIPGKLFSVNPTTTENVERLFARNERAACIFDTEIGPVALVLVGAMIVASIETVWAGNVAPRNAGVQHSLYGDNNIVNLEKGDEMGRFKLGSTVVMLFPKGRIQFNENFKAGATVKMGEAIADLK